MYYVEMQECNALWRQSLARNICSMYIGHMTTRQESCLVLSPDSSPCGEMSGCRFKFWGAEPLLKPASAPTPPPPHEIVIKFNMWLVLLLLLLLLYCFFVSHDLSLKQLAPTENEPSAFKVLSIAFMFVFWLR